MVLKDQTEVKKSSCIYFKYGEECKMEKYVLKAVLFHQGENTDAGHYTTYAKHGSIWHHFNDHSVFKPPQGTISICLKSKIILWQKEISVIIFTGSRSLSGVGSFFWWPPHFSEVIRLNLLGRLAQSTAIRVVPQYIRKLSLIHI